MKVAIQGAEGSYHHIAAQKYYGREGAGEVDFVYADTYAAVFTALSAGAADAALISIENSLYGSIPEVYELLVRYRYPIVGEIVERVHHNLVTFPDAKADQIQRIYSHPVALAQCAHYLASHFPKAEIVQHYDTAAAVQYVKRSGDRSHAAIAGAAAAELHGMYILERQIEDEQYNNSRFLAVEPNGRPPADANKATLVLTLHDEIGSLHRALGVFADLGSNLTKVRTRPIHGKTPSYKVYVEVEINPTALASAIEMLALQHCTVVNLGTYHASRTQLEE